MCFSLANWEHFARTDLVLRFCIIVSVCKKGEKEREGGERGRRRQSKTEEERSRDRGSETEAERGRGRERQTVKEREGDLAVFKRNLKNIPVPILPKHTSVLIFSTGHFCRNICGIMQ